MAKQKTGDYSMISISGNSVDGDLLVDAGVVAKDVDLVFTNNRVAGDAHIRSGELSRDICINACDYEKVPEENPMSPEVWFMYRNFYLDKKDVREKVKQYALGKVDDLVFYFEPEEYTPIVNDKTIGLVIRCMNFLARYSQ